MKYFSVKTMPAFLLALFIFSAFTIKSERANFSGHWQLNESKSELGQFANYATKTIQADQQESSIAISRTAASFNGDDMTTKEVLTFDGKEVETVLFGESKKKATASWSDDGQMLTITYTLLLDFNGQTNEISGKETWTLADDGKTLISQNKSSSSFGDLETKAVYEKQ